MASERLTASDPWPDDSALVRAVRAGDDRARERLGERLAGVPEMVRARDRHFGSQLSPHDVEEVVQESLASLWARLGRYRGTSPIEAWAYGFVLRHHHRALVRRRRLGRWSSLDRPNGPEVPAREDASTWDEGQLQSRMREALDSLDESLAQIVHRKHFDGLTFVQISHELGLSSNTVKTRYYRALKRLRAILMPIWREEEA